MVAQLWWKLTAAIAVGSVSAPSSRRTYRCSDTTQVCIKSPGSPIECMAPKDVLQKLHFVLQNCRGALNAQCDTTERLHPIPGFRGIHCASGYHCGKDDLDGSCTPLHYECQACGKYYLGLGGPSLQE
eukprot:SAG25_NODE_324_length_9786_cov_33.460308_10_plen_128_part_00